jgi:glycosyltransferase involved in cell wall biosynthesis
MRRLLHFHNGLEGGVKNYILRLIEASQDQIPNQKLVELTTEINVAQNGITYINPLANKYWEYKRNSGDILENDVIIAHTSIGLEMISSLGLNNPSGMVLHGDYEHYYKTATLYQESINHYYCVSKSITSELKSRLPERSNDIYELKPIIPEIKYLTRTLSNPLNIVFVGRLTKAKGFDLLSDIDAELEKLSIKPMWHVIGTGDLKESWEGPRIKYYGELSESETLSKLSEMDVFVLPSQREGMPLSLLEAMQAKLICLVNNFNNGVSEVIEHQKNGFILEVNHPSEYARYIQLVVNSKDLAQQIKENANDKIQCTFNSDKTISKWKKEVESLLKVKNRRKKLTVGHSRLDNRYLPNFLTKSIRMLNKS